MLMRKMNQDMNLQMNLNLSFKFNSYRSVIKLLLKLKQFQYKMKPNYIDSQLSHQKEKFALYLSHQIKYILSCMFDLTEYLL
jgi:hypothetical protein